MAAAAGLILYVHGARDPRWAEPFLRLREKVAARAPGPVVLAFLEHGTPSLAAAAAALASLGVTSVRVVPLFFGRGGHLREDMPKQLVAAQAAAPGVTFDVTEAAGENESVLEALASFALGVVSSPGSEPDSVGSVHRVHGLPDLRIGIKNR